MTSNICKATLRAVVTGIVLVGWSGLVPAGPVRHFSDVVDSAKTLMIVDVMGGEVAPGAVDGDSSMVSVGGVWKEYRLSPVAVLHPGGATSGELVIGSRESMETGSRYLVFLGKNGPPRPGVSPLLAAFRLRRSFPSGAFDEVMIDGTPLLLPPEMKVEVHGVEYCADVSGASCNAYPLYSYVRLEAILKAFSGK